MSKDKEDRDEDYNDRGVFFGGLPMILVEGDRWPLHIDAKPKIKQSNRKVGRFLHGGNETEARKHEFRYGKKRKKTRQGRLVFFFFFFFLSVAALLCFSFHDAERSLGLRKVRVKENEHMS